MGLIGFALKVRAWTLGFIGLIGVLWCLRSGLTLNPKP